MFIEIGLALAGAGGYVIYRIKSKKIEETELNVVKPKKIENNYFICLQCNKRIQRSKTSRIQRSQSLESVQFSYRKSKRWRF